MGNPLGSASGPIKEYEFQEAETIMPIVVRPARPSDASIIVEFNCRMAMETEGKALEPAVVSEGVAAVLRAADKGAYFVAENEEAIVGQLMITLEWSDWRNRWIWWIQSVYVRPDARRQGVFRALYDHVHEAALRNPEVIGLRLYVEKDNRAAQETYRGLGMTQMPFLL